MTYVPLHVHSEYSLLDSSLRVADLVRRCREEGLPACALTDHGNLYGAVEFHDACLAQGVKPILGCELYVARGSRFERPARPGPEDAMHLVVLARDAEGWRNLSRLVSLAHLEGEAGGRPRVDKALLAECSAGLTALSGCREGEVALRLLRGDEAAARAAASEYRDIFGPGAFYVEVQDHGLPGQDGLNAAFQRLSRDLKLPLVATPDCHYLDPADAEAHAALLCLRDGTTLGDPDRPGLGSDEFHFMGEAEMRRRFAWAPEAVDATAEVAAACGFTFPKAAPLLLPAFDLPAGFVDADAYLRHLCLGALPARYGPDRARAAEERLAHELAVIAKLGYAGYFLVVGDFVAAARRMGVRVGPGRGSAGGSLTSHLLGITAVDPLAKGLIFERFLNPDRVSPPDIDVDFADDGRARVIAYVVERYGRERVAQISAFGRLAARAVLRDVGRVLDAAPAEVDALARLVPAEPDMTLEKALRSGPELGAAVAGGTGARVFKIARALEGLPRHVSTHAAGVVIGQAPLIGVVPLRAGGSGDWGIATQFDMASLERLGLVKMDFLGLRTLSVLDEACRWVEAQGSPAPDLENLPDGEADVFAMLARGDSHGVFQLESWGMRDLLRRFKPRTIEDLDRLIALFRPGPMRMIDSYLRRREGREPAVYDPPGLEPILESTHGIVVYQEQVMRIAMDLAGFSAAGADLLRRAMGKKDPALIEAQRRAFVAGCADRGVAAPKAEALFDQLARFAEYGFNKAHSAAYALLGYQTAWLKARHPEAFWAALLSSEAGSPERVRLGLAELRRAGLKVLPPDVNVSGARFRPEAGGVRFGLAAVRHVGEGAMEALEQARRAGPFTTLQDLLERCESLRSQPKAVEQLIKAGALDALAPGGAAGRAALDAQVPAALDRAARSQADRATGQASLFGDLEPPPAPDAEPVWDDAQRLAFEKEALGFTWSGHPLAGWEGVLRGLRCAPLAALAEGADGSAVSVGGWVASVRSQATQRGESMARLSLEDTAGACEVLVWPRVLESARAHVHPGARLWVRGRLELGGEEPRLVAERIVPLDRALAACEGLRVTLPPSPAEGAEALLAWARAHPGGRTLWLRVPEGNAWVLQKSGLGVELEPAGLKRLSDLGLGFRLV